MVYAKNSTLVVTSAPVIHLNAPTITTAQFSNNGSKLLISFDIATDGGSTVTSTFKCSDMFTFLGSNTSTCHWDNGNNITMIVDDLDDNSVLPGMYLSINNDINIYAQCPVSSSSSDTSTVKCMSPRSSSSLVLVLSPSSIDLPVLSVSAPAVLGDCQDYRYYHYYSYHYTSNNTTTTITTTHSMDFASCSGTGGRKWRVFHISLTTTDTNITNNAIINTFISKINKYQPYVTIPHDYFVIENKYTFSIYMCTFLLGNNHLISHPNH